MSTSPVLAYFGSPFLWARIPGLGWPTFDPISGFLNLGNYFWRAWSWWDPRYGVHLDSLLVGQFGEERDIIPASSELPEQKEEGSRRGKPKKRRAPKVDLEIEAQILRDKSIRGLIDDLLIPAMAAAIVQQLTEGTSEERE